MNIARNRKVKPCSVLSGTVTVPGDKSISHRAAMLSALASGRSVISGFLCSEDCLNTLKAVEQLGAGVQRNGDKVVVTGTAGRFSPSPGALDMGNSGTGIRLISGLLAGHWFESVLTGDESLCSRPMGRIKEPLEKMGARLELTGNCAPIRISGGGLRSIEYKLPVASAQVKSCVLLAGLFAAGRTVVEEPKPTRDHTEKMLQKLGADVTVDDLRISVAGSGGAPLELRAGEWVVPGDFSSAAFWIVAAACSKGSCVTIENVGLNPRRTALLDVLKRMGADISINQAVNSEDCFESAGVVTVRGSDLCGTVIEGDEIPNLIDELPIAAVAGVLASGETVIKDAAELRVKESDRIAATVSSFARLGVDVVEKSDGMVIKGGQVLKGGGTVESLGDHRIAMATAVAALFADAPVDINNVACVDTSYPGFWADLDLLTGRS